MRRLHLSALAAAVLFIGFLAPVSDVAAQESEPRNLSFDDATPAGGAPPGWSFIQHAGPPSFEFAVDNKAPKGSHHSLRIKRTGAEPFGLVAQGIKADRFRGKRARLTAQLRLDDVQAFAMRDFSGATLMLRSMASGGVLALDDMRDRPLRGTKAWTKAQVEIDVPANVDRIEFGANLSGTGTLWVTAFRLEVVEPGAAKTTP
jgi:hypothetical protein